MPPPGPHAPVALAGPVAPTAAACGESTVDPTPAPAVWHQVATTQEATCALGAALPGRPTDCRVGGYYPCTSEPVRAGGASAVRFARLAAASRGLHECGLTADRRGFCWGRVTLTGVPDLGNSFYGGLTDPVPFPDR